MKLLFVLALLFVGFIALTNLLRRSASAAPYRYRRNHPFLSKAERSFFGVLQQAVGTDAIVFAKIRVADVLTPDKGPRQVWQAAFNRISAKHFDFLICDVKEISALLAIELDDSSHAKTKRIARDDFLDAACATAGLPLLRVPARHGYSIHELRARIAAATERSESAANGPSAARQRIEPAIEPPAVREEPLTESSQVPACPRCAEPMKRQTGRSGALSGLEFWQCEKAPECSGVRPMQAATPARSRE